MARDTIQSLKTIEVGMGYNVILDDLTMVRIDMRKEMASSFGVETGNQLQSRSVGSNQYESI